MRRYIWKSQADRIRLFGTYILEFPVYIDDHLEMGQKNLLTHSFERRDGPMKIIQREVAKIDEGNGSNNSNRTASCRRWCCDGKPKGFYRVMKTIEEIKALINRNKVDEAIEALHSLLIQALKFNQDNAWAWKGVRDCCQNLGMKSNVAGLEWYFKLNGIR